MSIITFFLICGLGWLIVAGLITLVFIGVQRIRTPKPEPTQYEKDWADIERRLSE